jgi:hypothetical protein
VPPTGGAMSGWHTSRRSTTRTADPQRGQCGDLEEVMGHDMKAAYFEELGDPDKLIVGERPTPEVGAELIRF